MIHYGMVKDVEVFNVTGIPWFHKVLNSHTTDYIELKVCGDTNTDEDTPVSLYELYVK